MLALRQDRERRRFDECSANDGIRPIRRFRSSGRLQQHRCCSDLRPIEKVRSATRNTARRNPRSGLLRMRPGSSFAQRRNRLRWFRPTVLAVVGQPEANTTASVAALVATCFRHDEPAAFARRRAAMCEAGVGHDAVDDGIPPNEKARPMAGLFAHTHVASIQITCT